MTAPITRSVGQFRMEDSTDPVWLSGWLRLLLTGTSLALNPALALAQMLLEERHLAFQRLVIAEALRHPRLGLTWYRNGPEPTRSVLRGFLAEHQALGHVRQDVDLSRAAVLLHDMIVGDLLNRAMMAIEGGPKSREIEMTIRQAIKMATTGLGPNGQGGDA
jgi:AefR-like transcriptional repressor, C-terminal domain